MRNLFFAIFSVFALAAVLSCRERTTDEAVSERVDSFATHYYNWQYHKCVPYITESSLKQLKLLATNVTQSDVDTLRAAEYDAEVEISDIEINGDSLAFVTVDVSDVYVADTIGRKARRYDSGMAVLRVVRQGGNWFVDFPDAPIRTAYRQQSVSPSPSQSQD